MKLLANLFLLWMSEAQHSTKTLRNVKTKYEHMHRAAFMRRRGGCDQWSPYSPGQASADRSMGDQQNPHPPQDSKSTYQGGKGEKGRGGEPCTWRPSAVTLGTQTLEIHCGNLWNADTGGATRRKRKRGIEFLTESGSVNRIKPHPSARSGEMWLNARVRVLVGFGS